MNIMTIVGARPQFIKAAPVIRAISRQADFGITHYLLHTGQHYDREMSGAFFEDLDLPEPQLNLGIGGSTHGDMTGRMLIEIERVLMELRPDWVIVYGDTDSTLAGGLAAAKLQIPVAHVEAGLRSFNQRMPEEINRVLTDHISELLLCPTRTSVDNLVREGIKKQIAHVGDVMYDAALYYRARMGPSTLDGFDVRPRAYFLATCHRAENTDDPDRLRSILDALGRVAAVAPVIIPLHPRTKRRLAEFKMTMPAGVRVIAPVGYISMMALESHAIAILTDSGGVQKEAYFYGVPCVTMRAETEWIETTETGWNTVVDTDAGKIFEAAIRAEEVRQLPQPDLYGSGNAADDIVNLLVSCRR